MKQMKEAGKTCKENDDNNHPSLYNAQVYGGIAVGSLHDVTVSLLNMEVQLT